MRKITSMVGVSLAAAGLALGASGIANAAATSFGSGIWIVGEDIASGVYETESVSPDMECRVSFYNENWGETGRHASTGRGVKMTVDYATHAVSTSYGCGIWRRVADAPAPPAPDLTGAAIGSAAIGSAVVGSAVLPLALPLLMAGSSAL